MALKLDALRSPRDDSEVDWSRSSCKSRTKDEGGSRRKNHVVEVRRALDREVTKSPYLARQLSVFDDWQLIMGLLKMMIEGLRRMLNSTVNAKR